MRNVRFLFLGVLLLFVAGSLAAQQAPAEVSRVYFVTPKPGMELQFEKAVRAHADWHRQRKDTWRWDVRYTDTGRRTGEYIFISGGHQWKDLDNPPVPAKDDGEHFLSTVAQFVASSSSILLVAKPELSRGRPTDPPAPLTVVTYFYVKFGQGDKFERAIRQIREALDKTDSPLRPTWLQLVASGRNAYVLSSPRENWAAMELTGPSLRERVEKVHGRAGADAIFQAVEESVDFSEAKITMLRPDLSYVP